MPAEPISFERYVEIYLNKSSFALYKGSRNTKELR
jgi:hypothetical protein